MFQKKKVWSLDWFKNKELCLLNSFSNIDILYFLWYKLGNNYQLLVTTMYCKLPTVTRMREREIFIRLWKVIRNSSINHWSCKPWNCQMKFHMNEDKKLDKVRNIKGFLKEFYFKEYLKDPKAFEYRDLLRELF